MYKIAKMVYQKDLKNIKDTGLYKEERYIKSQQGANISVEFRSKTNKLLNLCSNNYLGLSSNPSLIEAAHNGLETRGFGMSSVRFICGTQDIHRELEYKLANFLKMDDSILFSSCFDANAALFEAILTPEDAVFSDKLIHASLIDGIRLCKAQKNIYEHLDTNDLENKLKNSSARIKLIITDGVFSMDGDIAPLDKLADLADKYDALLAVDDSHATGFIGKTGRGTPEFYNVMDRVDIITTTFGKGLGGAMGGAVIAKQEIVDLLRQKARPYLFSNALMPAVTSATIKAIDLIFADTSRRDKLEANTKYWRKSLKNIGFDIKDGNTPIIPIMLYDARLAQKFSIKLYEHGIYAVGFFYPVVPKGEARIRTQMSAMYTREDLEKAIEIFKNVGIELGVIKENTNNKI